MKKFITRAAAASATIAASSVALASTVFAQNYGYDYTYSTGNSAAAASVGFGVIALYCCIACIPLIILVALAVFVYKDAEKYKVENGALWAVLTFFTGLVGLLIYFLAIRPDYVKKMESKGGSPQS